MNKNALFGISFILIFFAFVVGFFIGGYAVLKTQGVIDNVMGFVKGDSSTSFSPGNNSNETNMTNITNIANMTNVTNNNSINVEELNP